MRKIAIYCRVSTDEQAKNKEGSLTSQVQRLRLKVDEKNKIHEKDKWGKVVKVYEDRAYSGKNTDRPEFQKMLADVKSGRINTIMVTELSRLSRSVTDFLNFIKEIQEGGCDFICLQYDFDTTSPVGRVFMTIIMALAQFERELTAERIKNNFHARALRGLSNGGNIFLGYDRDPAQSGRFIVNKKEASLVRDIFQLYLQGDGLAEVAYKLNARGSKNKAWVSKRGNTRGGKPFCIGSIWRILTHYGYIGKREVNKAQKDLPQDKLNPEARYSIVSAAWEAIIDPENFKKAQDKLKTNKRTPSKPNHDFLLSGLLVCDECGGPLCGQTAKSRDKKHFYYGHTKKVTCLVQRYNAQDLERLIKRKLFALLNNEALNKQFVEALALQNKEQPKRAKVLLEAQKREAEKLKQETENLVQLVSQNPLAKEMKTLLTKIQENEKHLVKIEEEKQRLEEKALLETENQKIDVSFVLSSIDRIRKDSFRKAKLSERKAVLRELIQRIHVHPENVIRLDLRANKYHSDDMKTPEQKGVVLPFHKLGRPLEASFDRDASGGVGIKRRYAEIRKAVDFGTHVLAHTGYLGGTSPSHGAHKAKANGSSCFRSGATYRNRPNIQNY